MKTPVYEYDGKLYIQSSLNNVMKLINKLDDDKYLMLGYDSDSKPVIYLHSLTRNCFEDKGYSKDVIFKRYDGFNYALVMNMLADIGVIKAYTYDDTGKSL